MPDQELSRHEGEVDLFDISPDGIIEEECKSHKIGDIVLSIISAYDPKALQDFLDFKKIQSFTFLYPGGYVFLPTPHLIILREGNNVLVSSIGPFDSSKLMTASPDWAIPGFHYILPLATTNSVRNRRTWKMDHTIGSEST